MEPRLQEKLPGANAHNTTAKYLHAAGVRYWPASLLPALVGSTLPLWIQPLGFSFRWIPALEFAVATILFHAGFSLLHCAFAAKGTEHRPKTHLIIPAGFCIVAGCLLGLHINSGLMLHEGVHEHIFLVFGMATLFAGALYVIPPLRFYERVGGEIVLAEGLGMLPVVGGFLVQAGDVLRVAYLASLPIVAATWLWVWMDELITASEDRATGRETLVLALGERLSARWVVPMLLVGYLLTVAGAVYSKAVPPAALVLLLVVFPGWRIVRTARLREEGLMGMARARRSAVWIHAVTCGGIIVAAVLAYYL